MGEIASSFVSIYPKISSGFGRDLQSQITKASGTAFGPIDKKADESGKKAGRKFGDSFRSVSTPLLAGAATVGLLKFISDTTDAYNELQDTTAAAQVTFGDGMDKIIAQSERGAKTLGMSKQQVIDAANAYGGYGEKAGLAGDDLADFSMKLTQVAGDLASFKGKPVEQAIEAIGAGLRGESEPLRAFGVLLDDATLRARALELGLIKTTKEALTPQQRVLAAQAEILAQTTKAQGDFARTAEFGSNVQKTLKAESADLAATIGEKLQPALVAAQKAGIGVIDWATRNQAALLPLAGAFTTIAAAIAGTVAVAKGLEALKTARGVVRGLGEAFSQMSTKAKIATASAGAIGIALTAASVIYGAFAQKAADAEAAVEDYTAALKESNGAIDDNVRAKAAQRLEDAGALEAAQRLGISLKDVTDAVLGQGDAMARIQAILRAGTGMGEQTAESVRLGEAARLLSGVLGDENTELQRSVEGYQRVAEAAPPATTATQNNTTATKTNSDALKTNAQKLNDVYRARLALRGDKVALEASYDAATKAAKENGETLDINTEKGRANRTALYGIAESALSVKQAMEEQKRPASEVNEVMGRAREQFIKAATAMTGSATKAKELADKLGLIKSKKVDVTVDIQWGKLPGPAHVKFEGGEYSVKAPGGRYAKGGGVFGGTPGVDSVPALLMPGEHILTTEEVRAAGGHQAIFRLRAMLRSGMARFATGGAGDGTRPAAGAFQPASPEAIGAAVAAALEARGISMLTLTDGVFDRFDQSYGRA